MRSGAEVAVDAGILIADRFEDRDGLVEELPVSLDRGLGRLELRSKLRGERAGAQGLDVFERFGAHFTVGEEILRVVAQEEVFLAPTSFQHGDLELLRGLMNLL